MARIRNILKKMRGRLNYYLIKFGLFGFGEKWNKIDICGGSMKIGGFCNIDMVASSDVFADMEKDALPFRDNSADTVICISAINYFSRERGGEIVADAYRVLKPGGVARFASQDLRSIAEKYVANDRGFFFQTLPNGKQRFHGETAADKINSWFYGYKTGKGKHCKYFYDFETLALIFKKAGFKNIQNKKYGESAIAEIKEIDNRPDQMFFLEATK